MQNPAVYFEIPVSDLDRAIKFYGDVFGFDFTKDNIHGNEMAFFPYDPAAGGITGGLAKGDIYKPTKDGVLIYFFVPDIDETIAKIEQLGSQILFPKTKAGDFGYVAEFEDSEGNRIGLSQK
jgi:predicted enzyme related to lactoylglutathione lyase